MKKQSFRTPTEEEMIKRDENDPVFKMLEEGFSISEISIQMGWPNFSDDPAAYLRPLDEAEVQKKAK